MLIKSEEGKKEKKKTPKILLAISFLFFYLGTILTLKGCSAIFLHQSSPPHNTLLNTDFQITNSSTLSPDKTSHDMATKIISLSSDTNVDDDYIDMELSSSSNFICYSINSPPPQSREFEFQMGSVSNDKETTTSPADELFYKGKLLPLHLPPRLKMVQKLLHNTTITEMQLEDQNCDTSFIASSTTPSTTNNNTPLESCNISPSESCRVSSELNPDEYFFEWSTELNSFIRDDQQKNPWTKKLKKSPLSQKLKASSAYIKSLFSKSRCTGESAAKPACNVEIETGTKTKEIKYMKIPKKNPMRKNIYNQRTKLPTSTTNTTLFKSIEKEMAEDYSFSLQRRSFSGAIQSLSTAKFSSFSSLSSSGSSSSSSSSSSSFSFGSNGFHDLLFLKRSSIANSELENSIEGAIAYCKQSQLLFSSRKTTNLEVGACSFSASENAACRDQQGPKLCIV